MSSKKVDNKLSAPKVTLNSFGQVIFVFKEILKLAARADRKFLVLVLLLNALWGATAAPGFYLEKLILDNLVRSIGSSDLRQALVIIGTLALARLLLELARNVLSRVSGFLSRKLSRIFHAELEVIISEKLGELDIATIEDPEFKNRFSKIERESGRRAWNLMMPLSDIPNYLIGFMSVVGILYLLHPIIALGVLVFSLPRFFISSIYIKREYELDTEISVKHRLWGWLSYYLVRNRNFMELKILNLSSYLTKRLRRIQKEIIGKQIELSKKRELSNFWSFIPLTLYEFGISLWLISLVVIERISVGSFELYLRSLRSAENNLSGLVNSILEVYENYIYVVDLVWFLNLKPQIKYSQKGEKIDPKKEIILKFQNVWFRYREDQPWVLKNLDFGIRPGEKIAIVGENGAGKSTLIKLLARFYDPQKGGIYVSGKNLKKASLKSWWKNLVILFQKFETYPFTARESIGYGDVERVGNMESIAEAAQKTGIDSFITDLPLRYENPLAPEFEKGVDPSIGQWQRIGIARMLFRKSARVVVMDEPTSNVDPEAEEKIFGQLAKISRDKILIFVTQRFSTVRIADRILVINKGQIVEYGTHDELMKLHGKYERLYTLQAQAYLDNN